MERLSAATASVDGDLGFSLTTNSPMVTADDQHGSSLRSRQAVERIGHELAPVLALVLESQPQRVSRVGLYGRNIMEKRVQERIEMFHLRARVPQGGGRHRSLFRRRGIGEAPRDLRCHRRRTRAGLTERLDGSETHGRHAIDERPSKIRNCVTRIDGQELDATGPGNADLRIPIGESAPCMRENDASYFGVGRARAGLAAHVEVLQLSERRRARLRARIAERPRHVGSHGHALRGVTPVGNGLIANEAHRTV